VSSKRPRLSQILDQARDRQIDEGGFLRVVGLHVLVAVPIDS